MFKTTTKSSVSIYSGLCIKVRSFNLKKREKSKNLQIAKLKIDIEKLKENDPLAISTNDKLNESIENESLSQIKKQFIAFVAENLNKPNNNDIL